MKKTVLLKYLKIYLTINLKIILLDNHQNNYTNRFSDDVANSFKF